MSENTLLSCRGCEYSRRTFLAGCAGCLGAAALPGLIVPKSFAAEPSTNDRMKVRVVFALTAPVTPQPDWPHIHFDANPVMEKTMNALVADCPEIEFIPTPVSSLTRAETPAAELKAEDEAKGDIDGYIVVQTNCWNPAIHPLVGTGKPVLYADFLYGGSGGFLRYTAGHLRSKADNFAHISSGNLAHLVAAAKCLPLARTNGNGAFVDAVTKIRQAIVAGVQVDMECADDKFDMLSIDELRKELKTKKMLEFEKGWADIIPQTRESLGIEIVRLRFAELNDLWEKADKDQAMEIVQRWQKTAEDVIDVPGETLEKSARMYLAMKQCLKNHDACAITINCLGGFYGKHIFAYPCLGFHELLNEGLVGACECDTISTITMIVMTALTKGRPGYISDPVMDIATKQIIYAHCVASNKVFGQSGHSNPFTIMTHSEDRQGASLRSTLPVGYMTTSLEMHPARKQILFHQGKSVANIVDDRACRTKIAVVPVGDFEKLYREWDQWSWHRVTYYGDLKEPVFALADALGWEVVEEA
ncbi:MAG: hypothetical protein FWH27_07870 [Planctomycetaceae bacterium]|nr:hypothetical protein [Planctomycetaceae bacterium]